jgi:hypothetical protein
MNPISEKIQQFYALKPTNFGLVSRFEWVTVPLYRGYAQRLVLQLTSLKEDESAPVLVLTFEDVRNLRFAAMGLVQPLLEVRDVSGRQWDGVTYEVHDTEHDTIFFLCRDFSFLVRRAGP